MPSLNPVSRRELVRKLKALGFEGPFPGGKHQWMQRVYLGACYARPVEVNGQQLGLAVNWDRDLQEWWVCVSPPLLGGKVEAQELVVILDDILKRVGGLHNLQWHTEGGWLDRQGRSGGR